jgi:hypothetical protein
MFLVLYLRSLSLVTHTCLNQRDDIRCFMSATFGRHRWVLSPRELAFPQVPDRFRYFARFLLEGKVVSALAKFTPMLKNKPNIFNKPWVKVRACVTRLGGGGFFRWLPLTLKYV